jgi:hypothetical protein
VSRDIIPEMSIELALAHGHRLDAVWCSAAPRLFQRAFRFAMKLGDDVA